MATPPPPLVFTARGFEALFSHIGTMDCAVCLTSQLFLQVYQHTNVVLAWLPPLLPVWMNVSPLTPWFLDFHTVQFSGSSSNFFCFKIGYYPLFVRASEVYLPMPPSWPEANIESR